MQSASLNDIRKTLLALEPAELTAICLRLSKYKKENKELLSYLLFEAENESAYVADVMSEMDVLFEELKFFGAYHYTKQIRKILRYAAKHIKYSGNPASEVEILMHFAKHLNKMVKSKNPVTAVVNIYLRQLEKIEKALSKLHEDIQYDYRSELDMLKDIPLNL